MLRGIWGDMDRYRDTYWSRYAEEGWYFAGDGAKYDDDGALWVLGRVDDVMNVSGHRISTSEVESALVNHHGVAEAAVVGAADETTGQGIVAFVILREGVENTGDVLIAELKAQVSTDISPIAKPRQITIVPELPKTRSGKIMRRLLRDVAEGRDLGDTSTLVDPQGIRRHPRQVGPSAPVRLFGSPPLPERHTGGEAPSRNFTSSFDVSQDSSATRMSAATRLCKDFPREERNTRTFRRSSSPTSR